MKEGEEKDIDRKFREGLTNSEDHIVYNDADWDAMEALLDERKKRRGFIFRLPFMLGAAAAMLLLALGLYFFWPNADTNNNFTAVKRKPAADSITSVKTKIQNKQQHEEIARKTSLENAPVVNGLNNTVTTSHGQELTETNKTGSEMIAAYDRSIKKTQRTLGMSSNPKDAHIDRVNNEVKSPLNGIEQQVIASVHVDTNANNQPVLLTDAGTLVNQQADTPKVAPQNILKDKKTKKLSLDIVGPKHPIVLSIIAAPDFNGVGSAFNRTQVGTNAGLLLSVGVTRKLTVSTGAVYSKKPYLVGMDQYHTNYKFKVQPDDVSADCRVLDIPLNVDYQVYNKGRNLFSVGTGLSSYFMLRENYHYNHSGYYNGPSDYNISNQNKHILGVVNLNATYQRRINSNFGINVQPYMKLPITNIGYGQVNLKSTGLAIGASWYLNTSASKK